MGVDEVKASVGVFARLPFNTPESALREAAVRALAVAERVCRWVQREASKSNTPGSRHGLAFPVYMAGETLGILAENLATSLRGCRLIDLEEQAQAIRCRAILSVQAHYRHIVGPAMVEYAACNERLSNSDRAVGSYEAVVGDFAGLADDLMPLPDPPSDEDCGSLQSLRVALDGMRRLASEAFAARRLGELAGRVDAILARAGE